jgi:hypothetical protein
MNILFLCSPGLGSLDNWLPIIKELKKKNYNLDFYVPKESILDQIETNIFFKAQINIYFNKLFYVCNKNNKINSINSLEKYKKNKIRLLANLINNFFIKYLSREFNFYNYYLYHFSNYKSRNINYKEFIKKYSYILCDASEFVKPYLKEFALSARSNMKISMCHGSDFPYYNINFLNKKKVNNFGYNFKIILFSKTSNEKNYYQKLLNLKEKNYYLIGNPKHSKSWINFIKKNFANKKDKFFKKKYVFLISRHSDKNYLPVEKKIAILKIIKEEIIDKRGVNLIIKLHPKEYLENYYYKVFGKKEYGIKWKFSKLHSYAIPNKNCLFSITFFSGVSVDMNILKVPNIEFLDLNKMNSSFFKEQIFFKKSVPMFRIRYLNLTLGSETPDNFKKKINYVINSRKNTINYLNQSYQKYYNSPKGSVDKIIKLIN